MRSPRTNSPRASARRIRHYWTSAFSSFSCLFLLLLLLVSLNYYFTRHTARPNPSSTAACLPACPGPALSSLLHNQAATAAATHSRQNIPRAHTQIAPVGRSVVGHSMQFSRCDTVMSMGRRSVGFETFSSLDLRPVSLSRFAIRDYYHYYYYYCRENI